LRHKWIRDTYVGEVLVALIYDNEHGRHGMTKDGRAALLKAYRMAIEAGQGEIADLLEKVMLAEMGSSVYIPATREIKVGDESLEPPWKVTCGSDAVPHGTTVECTGIDEYLPDVSPI